MTKKDWIVPGAIVAFFAILYFVLRKPIVPASAQIPSTSGPQSGVQDNTVPGPTQFAVAPPQLPPNPQSLQVALKNPYQATPVLNNNGPAQTRMPNFMVLNVPAQRDYGKPTSPNGPRVQTCGGDCGCCSGSSQCSACGSSGITGNVPVSTVQFPDGPGGTTLVAKRTQQTKGSAQPLARNANNIASVGFDASQAMIHVLNSTAF